MESRFTQEETVAEFKNNLNILLESLAKIQNKLEKIIFSKEEITKRKTYIEIQAENDLNQVKKAQNIFYELLNKPYQEKIVAHQANIYKFMDLPFIQHYYKDIKTNLQKVLEFAEENICNFPSKTKYPIGLTEFAKLSKLHKEEARKKTIINSLYKTSQPTFYSNDAFSVVKAEPDEKEQEFLQDCDLDFPVKTFTPKPSFITKLISYFGIRPQPLPTRQIGGFEQNNGHRNVKKFC